MTFLRRVLNADAALWTIFGLVIGIAPGWLLETVARQPPLIDDAWVRASGGHGSVSRPDEFTIEWLAPKPAPGGNPPP